MKPRHNTKMELQVIPYVQWKPTGMDRPKNVPPRWKRPKLNGKLRNNEGHDKAFFL